jgi:hypothetical protein
MRLGGKLKVLIACNRPNFLAYEKVSKLLFWGLPPKNSYYWNTRSYIDAVSTFQRR